MNSAGSRRAGAGPTGRRRGASAVAATVMVAAAAGVVLVTGGAGGPQPTATSEPSTVPVERATQACPHSLPPQTRVLTGSAPVNGLGSAGSVTRGPLGTEGRATGLQRGGLVSARTGAADRPALVTRAVGELAAGLFTFQAAGGSTLAAARCEAPASDWWFTGAGATLDHTSELMLTNLDPGPAVLDVRVLGAAGEIDTVGTRGLVVAPGGETSINLTDVAPQGEELAVHVSTSRGRVVAAMADSYAGVAGGARGEEWIPPQRAASRTVRLSGLPARADTRALVVANPSSSEALVSVEVAGESGSFAPTGVSEVRVPPGAAVSTDVTSVVGGGNVAVRLRSRVPVVAAVRSTVDGDPAYAPAVTELDGPAAVPLLEDADARVVVSAGSQPATATASSYDASGRQVESTEIEIVEEGTSSWTPRRSAAYVVVTGTRGAVSGAVSMTGDAGVTQMPLSSLPISLQQPVVHPVVTIP